MADYYFKMDGMAVGYQGKTLIHDINIGIDKGEIVTLGYVFNGWGSIWVEGDMGYINTSNKYIELI